MSTRAISAEIDSEIAALLLIKFGISIVFAQNPKMRWCNLHCMYYTSDDQDAKQYCKLLSPAQKTSF